MKNIKKLATILLALAMILSLATPVFADDTITSTVTNTTGHSYDAYQIFDGTQDPSSSTGTVLGEITWGSGIDAFKLDALMADVQAVELSDGTTPFAACEDAADIAEVLSGKAFNAPEAVAFAEVVSKYLSDTCTEIAADDSSVALEPGYYLLVDTTNTEGVDDVKNLSFLQVSKDEITITPKTMKPTVDKRVQDEQADMDIDYTNTEGWGETADHAINESFKFELTGSIPQDANLAAYDKYTVVFNDTMSKGITFESIDSVTVNGTALDADDYVVSGVAAGDKGELTWTLTIDDVKPHLTNLNAAVTVRVVYNAHLNEEAAVGNVPNNYNTVWLQYSNNPNVGGEGELGETNTDTVWVFTYEVPAQKKTGEGAPLDGAGFTLYTEAEYAKLEAGEAATPVSLVAGDDGYYYPAAASDTETVTEVFSRSSDGKFYVKGLDTGVYYLVETTIPAGYNQCDDIKFEITATHSEQNGTATTSFAMHQDDSASAFDYLDIINGQGATLPETGGIGTTIFYVLGGLMVLGAAVLLVTKKRMAA